MEHVLLIISLLGIHLLAVISPGPDLLMVIKNALRFGRNTGLRTSVGFGLGICVHIAYSIAGLALIISQSVWLFSVIKRLGAIYLIRIGIQSLTSDSSNISLNEKLHQNTSTSNTKISNITALQQGFRTNVLNPKATLFFLGLFTMAIGPNTPESVVIIASVGMILNTILWFSLVSIFLTHEKIRKRLEKAMQRLNKIFGIALIGLGLKVGLDI